MRRDFHLIRALLLAVEQADEPFVSEALEIAGYDTTQIAYHAALLAEAGLLDGEDASTPAALRFFIRRLTFQGHDFLDAVRAPSVWRKTCDQITRAGGGFVLSVVKDIAVSVLREELKL